MAVEETKHDLLLKRIQITVAILAGLATLTLGIYNVKKNIFSENGPGQITALVTSDRGGSIASARVEIFNSQNALVSSSTTQSDGSYSKKDLDSGSYSLRVSATDFEPQVLAVRVLSKKTADFQIVLRTFSPILQDKPSPVRSALEEVGASWIKNLGKPKPEVAEKK